MAVKAIPQWKFQKFFQQWQHSWAKCIYSISKWKKSVINVTKDGV